MQGVQRAHRRGSASLQQYEDRQEVDPKGTHEWAATPSLDTSPSLAVTPPLVPTQNSFMFPFSTVQLADIDQSEGSMQFETNWQSTGPDFLTDVASCQPYQQSQLGPVEAGDFGDLGVEGGLDFGGVISYDEGW